MTTDLNTRVHRFADWLKAGGIEGEWDMNLLNQIGAMKEDSQGNVIPESVGSLVRATMNAWELGESYGPPHRVNETFLYPDLQKKGVMIHQVNIDTKEDLDRIIAQEAGRTKVLYRGMREAKWPLYTSLQRTWMTEKFSERGPGVADFLKQLVHNARVAENGAIPEYIRGRGQDAEVDLAILSFIQHYGGPTPIQDWTFSFFNALFFAIDRLDQSGDTDDVEAYCSVYHIEQKYIEDGNLKSLYEEAYQSVAPVTAKRIIDQGFEQGVDPEFMLETVRSGKFSAFLRKQHEPVLREMGSTRNLMRFVESVPLLFLGDQSEEDPWNLSTNNNDNIVNQQGVFIWNSNPSEPVENVARELRESEHGWSPEYRFCHCYNINKKLLSEIELVLKKHGVVRPHIYPAVPVLPGGKDAEQIIQEVVRLTKEILQTPAGSAPRDPAVR